METATQEQLGGTHEAFHKQNGNGPNGHVVSDHSKAATNGIVKETNRDETKQNDEEDDVLHVYRCVNPSALDQITKPNDEQSKDVIANTSDKIDDEKNVIIPSNKDESKTSADEQKIANSENSKEKEVIDDIVNVIEDLGINEKSENVNPEVQKTDESKTDASDYFSNNVSSAVVDAIPSTNTTNVTNDEVENENLAVTNEAGNLPTASDLPESDVALLASSTNETVTDQSQNKPESEISDTSDQKRVESGSESDQKSEPECDIGQKVASASAEQSKSGSNSSATSPAAILPKECDIFNFKSGSIKKKDLVPDKVPWNENEIKPLIEATYKTTTWDDIWESKMKNQPLKPLDIDLPKPKVNKSVESSSTKQSSPKILKDSSKPVDPNVAKVVKTTRFKITPHVDIPTVEEEAEPSPPRENSEEGSSEHILPPDAPRIESNLNELTMVESQLKKLGVAAEEMVLKKQLKSLRVDMEDDVDEIILQRRDSNRHTMTVTPHTKLSKAKTLTRRNSNTETDGSGGITKRLGWLNIFKKRPSTTPPPQTPPPEKEKPAGGAIPKAATTTAKRLTQPPLLAQLNPRVLVIPEVSCHGYHRFNSCQQ